MARLFFHQMPAALFFSATWNVNKAMIDHAISQKGMQKVFVPIAFLQYCNKRGQVPFFCIFEIIAHTIFSRLKLRLVRL